MSKTPADPDDPSIFTQIRHTNEEGHEYWSSRELAKTLGYEKYANFEQVVDKAKIACATSGQPIKDHFADVGKMIEIGKGGHRSVKTVLMSRYACYLAIQNADPSKPLVALGQTYFAVQTRRQELSDEALEDERRLVLRNELRHHNVSLAEAAQGAGITKPKDYAIFQDHGYRGLYGGLGQRDIHRRKGLQSSQKILDHMGSAELAANLFRATQADQKIRREGIFGKERANQTHHEVGVKVRQTIAELGGTMPEDLPTCESIKTLEAQRKKASLLGQMLLPVGDEED